LLAGLSIAIQRHAIVSPQTCLFLTNVYPFGSVTLDVLFFPLNSLDYVRLVHPVCPDAHLLSNPSNFLKPHFNLLDAVFYLTVIGSKAMQIFEGNTPFLPLSLTL
jgi:hypothetical protein